MKRLYIAGLFLILSLVLCTTEQIMVEKVCKTSVEYLDSTLEELHSNDYKAVEKSCKKLNKYWQRQYKYLSAIIDNSQLNGFSISVDSLEELANNKSDSLEYELINAKKQIESISDNQKISFGNIF